MQSSRRSFLQDALLSGAFAGALPSHPGINEALLRAAGQLTNAAPAEGQHDSQAFWSQFATGGEPEGVHGRGLLHKSAANTGAEDVNRQIDFLHYTKDKTLRYANTIDESELLEYPGDVTVSVNVGGFRMAGEDQAQFQKLQSAQLRIDVLQSKSLLNILDPMAWTSLAALFPDKSGKLPPLQDLGFDPATTWEKMQKIVLPGGSGQWAINLSMAHKESTFLSILKNLTTEINRFAPVLGLPAISMTALKSFCTLYGALEQRTTFLLNSYPQRAFATRLARAEAQTQQGFNLVPGDYVLVPHAYTADLAPHFDNLELRQGYLVPKNSPATSSVYDLAMALKPDITYVTATIGLKPLTQEPTGDAGNTQAQDPSTTPKKSTGKKN